MGALIRSNSLPNIVQATASLEPPSHRAPRCLPRHPFPQLPTPVTSSSVSTVQGESSEKGSIERSPISSSKLSTSNTSDIIISDATVLTTQLLENHDSHSPQYNLQLHSFLNQPTKLNCSHQPDVHAREFQDPQPQKLQRQRFRQRPQQQSAQTRREGSRPHSNSHARLRRHPQPFPSRPFRYKTPSESSNSHVPLYTHQPQRASAEGVSFQSDGVLSPDQGQSRQLDTAGSHSSSKHALSPTRNVSAQSEQSPSGKSHYMFCDFHSTGQLGLRSNPNPQTGRVHRQAPHLVKQFALSDSTVNASSPPVNPFESTTSHAAIQSLTALTDSQLQLQSQSYGHLLQQPVRSLTVQPDISARAHLLGHDTVNGNSDRSTVPSGAKEQSSAVSATDAIRRPILYLAKYGASNSWAADVFALPHNAIRAECIDLYNILESIHARGRQVCVVELEEFFVWWSSFEVFVIEYFDFEADILFPWVFSLAPVSGNRIENETGLLFRSKAKSKMNVDSLMRNSLLARKDVLLDSIRQLNGTFELRRHVDTADIFETILEEVNNLVPKLLEYFHAQERHLPQLANQTYSSSAKDVIAKKYVQYIRRGEAPQMNLVLLTRWMDSEHRDKWVRSHVRGYGRLMYRRWERKCEKSHAMIAARFHRRLQRSVKSVAASRLRRRTEFGEEIDDISFGSFPSHGGGSIRSLSLAVGNRASQKAREGLTRLSETNRTKSKSRT